MIIHWRQRWNRAQAAQNFLSTWVIVEYLAGTAPALTAIPAPIIARWIVSQPAASVAPRLVGRTILAEDIFESTVVHEITLQAEVNDIIEKTIVVPQ